MIHKDCVARLHESDSPRGNPFFFLRKNLIRQFARHIGRPFFQRRAAVDFVQKSLSGQRVKITAHRFYAHIVSLHHFANGDALFFKQHRLDAFPSLNGPRRENAASFRQRRRFL